MESDLESTHPFTREEENRLSHLQHRAEGGEALTEPESLELALLKRRYHTFVEEGERRLRAAAPTHRKGSNAPPNSMANSEGEANGAPDGERNAAASLVRAGKAAYFWGTLLATAVPGYVGRVAGVTTDFLHWNWVTSQIVLGAIPVVTQVGSSGDHLSQLRVQLEEHHQTLGLVIACLEEDELSGYGMNVVQFAKKADWQKLVNPTMDYVHLPMVDTTANTPLSAVAEAVTRMDACIRDRGEVVYVHCKAGKGRSWMVVMCYLTTCGGLSFTAAMELLQQKRLQVNPSSSQRKFAQQFPLRFAEWRSLKDTH